MTKANYTFCGGAVALERADRVLKLQMLKSRRKFSGKQLRQDRSKILEARLKHFKIS